MKMKLLLFIITGCILLSGLHALADNISMSSEQSDYYFLTGTEAEIPFTIDSPFQSTLAGTLQYSVTKHQDDGGFSLSQTSTQAQSFPVAPGRSNHALTLSAETETDYDLSLLLSYSQNGKDFAVVLPPLSVHFVSDSKNISEQKNTVRSSTSEATKSSSQASSTDPFDQMDQQMEQMRQEQQQFMQNFMSQSSSGMNSVSQQVSQNPQQALQNNQMSSSSSALQQQMMEESKQAQEDKQKLSESLENDPLIQEQASELRNAGYNQTNGRIVSTGPDRGEVSVDFKNPEGEKVSVTGKAENSQISSLTAKKSGEIPVSAELDSNTSWNQMKDSVKNSSMVPSSGSVTRTPDNTTVTQNYAGPDGRNATLSAWIVNGNVENITLVQDEPFPIFWLVGIFLVIILIVLCAGLAWWYFATRKEEVHVAPEEILPVRDYRELVQEMIENAEKSYVVGEKKEGYILLGQALRTFVSHRYGTGNALTSEEIISGVSHFFVPEKEQVNYILNSCSMVEYVREEPDDDEFYRMITDTKNMIDMDNSDS